MKPNCFRAATAAVLLGSALAATAQTSRWEQYRDWPQTPAVAQPSKPAAPSPPGAPAPRTPSATERVPPTSAPVAQGDHAGLGAAIARKFEVPAFAAARKQPGKLPPPSFNMPEERPVREARDRLALKRVAPPGTNVLLIPVARAAPKLDGMVEETEWRGALQISMEPADRHASVLLLVQGGRLFLAGLAPGDRTATGFDQFRFWFHLNLSPYLVSERVFIGSKGHLNALRGTRVLRQPGAFTDAPAPDTLRDDVDWYVYGKLQGASTVTQYRQFEMAIDLAEAGLAQGVAFPAFFEIEGDPVYEGKKFKARTTEGEAGGMQQPIWLRIGR